MLGANDLSLVLRMRGDSSDARQASEELRQKMHGDVDAIEKDFDRFGGAASKTSSILAGFAGGIAALAVSSLTSALTSGAKALLDYSARMEQTRIAFTSLIGNADKANKHLTEFGSWLKIKSPLLSKYFDSAGFPIVTKIEHIRRGGLVR